MKESYDEGLATHIDPESCGGIREGAVEALTGVRAGQVLSREMDPPLHKWRELRGADAVGKSGRHHSAHRYREMRRSPARSETLCMLGNTSRENREVPCSPAADGAAGRVEKSKDVRRR